MLVENNLVYRTTHGGFHLHYGRENVVRNNIFAFGGDMQIRRSVAEAHLSFVFERNIVYWTNGSPLTGALPTNVRYEHNLYGGIAPTDFRAAGMTWDGWRTAGQDEHWIIADPPFADQENGDFMVKSDSPAAQISFRPFDVARTGPRIR